jgi:hypothetical protein
VTSFPATCANNEELLVTGQTFTGKGTLIEAGPNCKLTIRDSTLKADVIVETKGNAELTITNSKLEGQEEALLLANHAKVTIGANLELTVDDSVVESQRSGVKASTSPR